MRGEQGDTGGDGPHGAVMVLSGSVDALAEVMTPPPQVRDLSPRFGRFGR